MACKIHLTPLNAGGSPSGRWFLSSAPVGFDGSLSISCDDITYVTISPITEDVTPLDNSCPDSTEIYVDIDGEVVGTYVFTFVSPDDRTGEDCAEDCVDCATFTIEAEEVAPEDGATYCDSDTVTYNVFDLLSIFAADYDIISVTGCTLGDPDCVASNGAFTPEDMGIGVYVVTLERDGALEGCDDCQTIFTITVEAAGDAGDDQDGVVCITPD